MILQYKINNYLLDLYFPKYKLIIECDESKHQRIQNKLNDENRENQIKSLIKDYTFIRYNPEEKDFNIFTIINKIFNYIVNCRCSNIILKEI
jgi:very-short-patch-repair endonuclease